MSTATIEPKVVDGFSPSSQSWLEASDAKHRKNFGQYMTPRQVREKLLDLIELEPGMRVLDPGVGTGEFLASALARVSDLITEGWDVDPAVLGSARKLLPGSSLIERSALDPYFGDGFDVVIGNPPYFQFKAAPEVKSQFARVISGRPNIFALFFQAGLEALKPGGTLAYVVPPSMNNGAYFESLREYIAEEASVESLRVLDGNDLFEGANTAVQLIVLRKGKSTNDGASRHIFRRACQESGFRRTVFAERPELLVAEFEDRLTLWEAGYRAATGTVVWNQHKEALSVTPTPETTPLIWAHNIQNGSIVLTDSEKKPQYVRTGNVQSGPALIVNRIVGAVGRGSLRAGLVDAGMEFVGENHVNVVWERSRSSKELDWPQLLHRLRSDEVGERIRMLTGNTQISATELTHLLPVDR